MRVLVWATTFGADLWSLAHYLDQRDDVELKVVMGDLQTYRKEGIATLFPLRSELLERRKHHALVGVRGFKPDVTVLDNKVPRRAPSPAGLVLWHGFGWKGPNDRVEFKSLHGDLRRCWGDPLTPNPNFRWQCFGPWDMEHRTTISGFAPENCRQIGAASHDMLREPLNKDQLQPWYPFDVVGRKTVVFAPTWHYGEVFAHWGRDAELFERLVVHLGRRECNLVLRLHDSFRFEATYVRFLEELARRHDHVLLKFKDRNPDNLLDLQVADVLVTNFSSIANLFYATRRPTVHVYPVRSADEAFLWRTHGTFGTRTREIESVRYLWKLPPETNGGLLAHDFEAVIAGIDQGLDEPDCCRERAQAFLDEHMMGADGLASQRAFEALEEIA